ncbi:hypothetical protein [Xanthomonas perforans]|uniref:hypothetical protein n=1 Tax=Xanthomonas perforans TaxID=442694 RepID=UPI0023592234|nr:hypothetical protein [Xanthomonas perforans]MDC9654339.1 hypothetical protein [Xanthomonas perforans]MEB2158980.1 hypothetical protein [Xanthomonas campestris pv. campestris]
MAVRFEFVFMGCALLVTVVGGLEAQTPTAGQLAEVQAQTILATAQAKLTKVREEAGTLGASQDTSEPVVSGIGGSPGNLYVTFYNHGNVGYRVGMSTPGGYVVQSVALNEVRLRRGSKSVVLHLSATAPVARDRAKPDAQQSQMPFSPFGSPVTLPPAAPASGGL